MPRKTLLATPSSTTYEPSESAPAIPRIMPRRSILKGMGIAGAALSSGAFFRSSSLKKKAVHSRVVTRLSFAFWPRRKSLKATCGCSTPNSVVLRIARFPHSPAS